MLHAPKIGKLIQFLLPRLRNRNYWHR